MRFFKLPLIVLAAAFAGGAQAMDWHPHGAFIEGGDAAHGTYSATAKSDRKFCRKCGFSLEPISKLILAGSDWHGANIIHALVRQSPWSRDISCLGFVPDQELPSFYRAAEALIFPSLFEGFGMPIIEAMACGCPVVCTATGAVGEVAAQAALPLHDPRNVGELAKHLVSLASDPALREGLRQKGLARAAEFDWKLTAQATLEVYHKALHETGVPAARPLVSTPAQAL
jgi:hypothetical protein